MKLLRLLLVVLILVALILATFNSKPIPVKQGKLPIQVDFVGLGFEFHFEAENSINCEENGCTPIDIATDLVGDIVRAIITLGLELLLWIGQQGLRLFIQS